MIVRLLRAPGGAVLLACALALALGARAAEDCADLARIPDCPPTRLPCTAATCPPQDCSTCTPAQDDDLDCVVDEELLNGTDDDGDALVDEDISCLNRCDPLSYACPSALFPVGDLTAPHPVDSPATLPARARQYACGGAAVDLDFTLTLEPDPATPVQFCGGFRAVLTVGDGAGTAWLRGPAILVLTRSWESLDTTLLDPPAAGNVAVTRHAVRADLAPVLPVAALPAQLRLPCLMSPPGFFHAFFAGHLDVARDLADPARRRHALVLHHSPSRLSHPPATLGQGQCETDTVSGRPLAPGAAGSHDGGWFLVAPRDGFAFAADAAVPSGEFRHGRIRALPSGETEPCEQESRICVSQFEVPAPPFPATDCGGLEVRRRVRFCGNQPDAACSEFALSSDTRCATIPSDLVDFFPVGRWSGRAFPGGMDVAAYEGALSCVPPAAAPWRPYWYGSYTRWQRPGLWPGPADALDVVDNMTINPVGSGLWMIGRCNWVFEGQPREMFRPLQFRAMRMFPDRNPEIPTLAPCSATAIITDGRATGCAEAPSLCATDVGPLVLEPDCSMLVNCCQCGGLEAQWSRDDGGAWTVLVPWGPAQPLTVDPPPAAPTTWRLEVRCSNSRTACASSADVTLGPASVTARLAATPGCNGPARLDASSSSSSGCAGGLEWRFLDPVGGVAADWSADPFEVATISGDWTVEARCASSPRCAEAATALARETLVEARASAPPGCNVASVLLDAAATTSSCPGLLVWRFVDPTATERQAFGADDDFDADLAGDWTVEARCSDAPACVSSVVVPVALLSSPSPALACWPLRVGHDGDEVTLDWSRARALVPGEHFHVRKDVDASLGAFPVVNAEGDTSLSRVETDTSAPLQFFDVRIANACEDESADDEPAGYDPPANGCR